MNKVLKGEGDYELVVLTSGVGDFGSNHTNGNSVGEEGLCVNSIGVLGLEAEKDGSRGEVNFLQGPREEQGTGVTTAVLGLSV